MDVLIIERDVLVRSVIADTLDAEGIQATTVGSDEEALRLPPDHVPAVVITSINRGHNEDLTGLRIVGAMRRKWPALCAVYLAALWPARLHRGMLAAGERFLTKPACMAQMARIVRELLASGLCGQRRSHSG